jgi:hypothetical protein
VEPDRLIKSPGSASRVGAIADRQWGSSGMIRPCVRAGISCVAAQARKQAEPADCRDWPNHQCRIDRQFLPALLVPAASRASAGGSPMHVSVTRGQIEWDGRNTSHLSGKGAASRRGNLPPSFLRSPAFGAHRHPPHRLLSALHGMAAFLRRCATLAAGDSRWSVSRQRSAPANTGADLAPMRPVRNRQNADCPRTNELLVFEQQIWRHYA